MRVVNASWRPRDWDRRFLYSPAVTKTRSLILDDQCRLNLCCDECAANNSLLARGLSPRLYGEKLSLVEGSSA